MTSSFGTLITYQGQAAIAAALVGGSPPVYNRVRVGDSSGTAYEPTEAQTVLVNALAVFNITSQGAASDGRIIIETIIPASVGGFTLREAGIFDAANVMHVVAKLPDRYKPLPIEGAADDLTLRFVIDIQNSSAVAVVIDPGAQIHIGRHVRAGWITVDGVVNAPPSTPAAGATYLIDTTPSGAFTGKAGWLAQWTGAWMLAPMPQGHILCDNSKAANNDLRFLSKGSGGWESAKAREDAFGFTRLSTLSEAQNGVNDSTALTPAKARFLRIGLDQLARLPFMAVNSISVFNPPSSPSLNDAYLIATGATGSWSGQTDKIAIWTGSVWFFVTANEGMVVRAADNGAWRRKEGPAWVNGYAGVTSSSAGVVTLADLTTAAVQSNSINPLTPATVARALSGGRILQRVYTTNDVWTRPSSDRFVGCWVEMLGGGGGGGLSASATADLVFGGGGSNGVYLKDFFARDELDASYTLTIGAAGSGRTTGLGAGNGGAGGNTSFGSVLIANGGNGGGGLSASHGAGGAAQSAATLRAGRTFSVSGTRGADGFEVAGITFPSIYGSIGQGGQGGYATSGGPSSSANNGGGGVIIITEQYF
jgi:hypothetical protein